MRRKGENESSFHLGAWCIISAQHLYTLVDIKVQPGTGLPGLEAWLCCLRAVRLQVLLNFCAQVLP